MGEGTRNERTIRRSVTVRPELNRRLRDFMASCTRHGIDVDYTQALNLFAILGEKWLADSSKEDRAKLRATWNSFLDYAELEESEALADWYELEEFRQWKQLRKGNAVREQKPLVSKSE